MNIKITYETTTDWLYLYINGVTRHRLCGFHSNKQVDLSLSDFKMVYFNENSFFCIAYVSELNHKFLVIIYRDRVYTVQYWCGRECANAENILTSIDILFAKSFTNEMAIFCHIWTFDSLYHPKHEFRENRYNRIRCEYVKKCLDFIKFGCVRENLSIIFRNGEPLDLDGRMVNI